MNPFSMKFSEQTSITSPRAAPLNINLIAIIDTFQHFAIEWICLDWI